MYELNKQIEKAATQVARSLGQEAEGVTDLRSYNERARKHDPSKLAWPSFQTVFRSIA